MAIQTSRQENAKVIKTRVSVELAELKEKYKVIDTACLWAAIIGIGHFVLFFLIILVSDIYKCGQAVKRCRSAKLDKTKMNFGKNRPKPSAKEDLSNVINANHELNGILTRQEVTLYRSMYQKRMLRRFTS